MTSAPSTTAPDATGVRVLPPGPGCAPGTVACLSTAIQGVLDGRPMCLDADTARDLIASLEARLPIEKPVIVKTAELKPGMEMWSGGYTVQSVVPEGNGYRVTFNDDFTCTYIPELEFSVKPGSIS